MTPRVWCSHCSTALPHPLLWVNGSERGRQRLTRRRLNAREAAEALGISVDALRMRCRRGTLECEHDENGRLNVWLDTDEPQSDTSALISAKDETIRVLQEQLESERKAHSEARRLLAAALERIPPQLEAPSEAQDQAQEPSEGEAGVEDRGEPERRPWWQRLFGG